MLVRTRAQGQNPEWSAGHARQHVPQTSSADPRADRLDRRSREGTHLKHGDMRGMHRILAGRLRSGLGGLPRGYTPPSVKTVTEVHHDSA